LSMSSSYPSSADLSSCSRLELLLLVDAFSKRHLTGQHAQRQACWDLQKARRQKARESLTFSNDISAMLIREELRAHVIVERVDGEEPYLAEEREQQQQQDKPDAKSGSQGSFKPTWKLKSTKQSATEKPKDVVLETTTSLDKENTAGLRNRKGSSTTPNKPKMYKTEEEIPMNEDGILKIVDPINLFGAFPPRDLRSSQKNAKESIEAYIDAANFACTLLKLIQNSKTDE